MAGLILDCDPGHDDAVALLLALASTELELAGVTTVGGNQTLEKTTANAIRVLEFAGRGDVPVAAGADRPLVRERIVAANVHGETGLDGPELPPAVASPVQEHAVDFLASHVAGRTLVPTGPLTNVALLLALHPEARPDRIVLMGGAIGEGNTTPAAEFNIWHDPEAARRVFESGMEITMVGLDVTHQAIVTPQVARRSSVAPVAPARSSPSSSTSTRASTPSGIPSSEARRCTIPWRSPMRCGRTCSRCGARASRSTAPGASAGAGRTSTSAAGRREPNANVAVGDRLAGVHPPPLRADRVPRLGSEAEQEAGSRHAKRCGHGAEEAFRRLARAEAPAHARRARPPPSRSSSASA